MPEKGKKTNVPASVPVPGDPDRKRVLNILAQRRYRQRKKEKIAELEAKIKDLPTPPHNSSPEQSNKLADFELQPDIIHDIDVEEVVREENHSDFAMLDFNQDPIDFGPLLSDLGFSSLPSPNPSTPNATYRLPSTSPSHGHNNNNSDSNSSRSPSTSLSPPMATIPPDSNYFIPHVLSTLRAFTTIATTLNVINQIYDPFYLHTLSSSSIPAFIPLNMHPTPAQLTIPHHPILDLLPWPSVREKLICVLSLPSAVRPPIAREEDGGNGQTKGIMQIENDLDDYPDGLRLHGCTTTWADGNELVEEAWEIGECFYRNWWWCLDTRVIEMTNRRRRERGLRPLRMIKAG